MEVYVLDALLRRVTVVDKFESLIWTERFQAYGDFELVLFSTKETRSQFTAGVKLAINNSWRVMTVETIENKIDSDGKTTLIVKGRSLEAWLEDRVAMRAHVALVDEPKWVFPPMTPAAVANAMFKHICIDGQLDLWDKLPFYTPGNIFPPDTINAASTPIEHEQEPATLYKALVDLCTLYDLGFRIVREHDTSKLYFNVYSGNDRTTKQKVLQPVVFSPDLDNLQNTTELTSIETSKNVAYVVSPAGFKVVYPEGVDPQVEGFERRVLMVNASDVTDAEYPLPEEVDAALVKAGLAELNKHRSFKAFDGELDQFKGYKYGTHYQLGDMVEMRNTDGAANHMRVTEQIFVSDAEGERAYPTLAINLFIYPGSWISMASQMWVDMDIDEYWATMP